MNKDNDLKVLISRHPGHFKCGEVSLSQISGFHWSKMSGGVHKQSSGYSLYGYIPYSLAMETVACSGRHDRGQNEAKVYIHSAKKGSIYYDGCVIARTEADRRSVSDISKKRASGHPCYAKELRSFLSTGSKTRQQVREHMSSLGCETSSIRNAITY